jgi:hypothetical protein
MAALPAAWNAGAPACSVGHATPLPPLDLENRGQTRSLSAKRNGVQSSSDRFRRQHCCSSVSVLRASPYNSAIASRQLPASRPIALLFGGGQKS